MENNLPQIPGAWKLMLLGDGSPTRHLQLLTKKETSIKLIAMQSDAFSHKEAPNEIKQLKKPLIRRQVWIENSSNTLAWAESWWNKKEAEHHMKNKNQPIWQSLTQGRSELFREVDGLALVRSDWLEAKFQHHGPFWSRHYRFFRHQKELTVIREVFNPTLEIWLGNSLRNQLNE